MIDQTSYNYEVIGQKLYLSVHPGSRLIVTRLTANNSLNASKQPKKNTRKNKRFWSRPWLLRRSAMGKYEVLMGEPMTEDISSLKNFIRMDPAMFRELLARM